MEIIHVGTGAGGGVGSGGGSGSELAQAIRAAKPGQVIRIHAGTYIEADGISISGSDITLENAGDGIAMISALHGPIVITASVTVRGLHFVARDASLPAVTVASGEPRLVRCTIQSLHVDIDARPIVEDCLISGSTSSGLIVSGAAGGVYRNNIIKLHSGYGVHCVSTGTPLFEGNIIMRTGCGAVCVSGVGGYARFEYNTIQDSKWVHGLSVPTYQESVEEDASIITRIAQQRAGGGGGGGGQSPSKKSGAAAEEDAFGRIKNVKHVGAGAVPDFVWAYAADEGLMAVTTRAAITVCGGASAHLNHNTVYNACAHGIIVASKWSVRVPFRKHNLGVLATSALGSTGAGGGAGGVGRASAANAAALAATRKTQKLAASVDEAMSARRAPVPAPLPSPSLSEAALSAAGSSSLGSAVQTTKAMSVVEANERKANEALALALEQVETGNVLLQAAPTRCIAAHNEVRDCTLTGLWACGQQVEVECAGNSFEQLGCEGVRVDLGAFGYLHHESITFTAAAINGSGSGSGVSSGEFTSTTTVTETVGLQCSGIGSHAILQDSVVKGAHTGVGAADGSTLTLIRTAVAQCNTGMLARGLARVGCENCTVERHGAAGCEVDTGAALCMVRCSVTRCCTGVAAMRGGKPEFVECNLAENIVAVRGTQAAAGYFRLCRFVGSAEAHVELASLANTRFEECAFGRGGGRSLVECRLRGRGYFVSNNFELVPRVILGATEATCLPREVQRAAVLVESGADPEFVDNLFVAAPPIDQQQQQSSSAKKRGKSVAEEVVAETEESIDLNASFQFDGSFVYPNSFVVVMRGGLGFFSKNLFLGDGPAPPSPEQIASKSSAKQLTFVGADSDGGGSGAAAGEDPNAAPAATAIRHIVGDAQCVRGIQTMRGGEPIVRSNTFQQMKSEAIFVADGGGGSFEHNLFHGGAVAALLATASTSSSAAAASSDGSVGGGGGVAALVRFHGVCGAALLRCNEFLDALLGVLAEDGAAPCIAGNVFHGSTHVAVRCRSGARPAILRNGLRRSNVPFLDNQAVRRRLQRCAAIEVAHEGTAPYIAFNTVMETTPLRRPQQQASPGKKSNAAAGGDDAAASATAPPPSPPRAQPSTVWTRGSVGAIYISAGASPTLHLNLITGEQIGVMIDGASSPRLLSNVFVMNELAVACIGSRRAAFVDNVFDSNDTALLVAAAAAPPAAPAFADGASPSPSPSWINAAAQPAPRMLRHDQLHPLVRDPVAARKMLEQDDKPPPLTFPALASEREAEALQAISLRTPAAAADAAAAAANGKAMTPITAAIAAASSPPASPTVAALSLGSIMPQAEADELMGQFHLVGWGNAFLGCGVGAVVRSGANVWFRGRDCFSGCRLAGVLAIGDTAGGEIVEAVFHNNTPFNALCIGGAAPSSLAAMSSGAIAGGASTRRRKSLTTALLAESMNPVQGNSGSSFAAPTDDLLALALPLTFSACAFSGLDSQLCCRRKRDSTFFRGCLLLASNVAAESGAAPVLHSCVVKWRADTDACASTAVSAESDARPILVSCSLRGVADGFMLRRCGALVAHCIVRKVRGVGITVGDSFSGLVTRCHISANGCGGIAVLGKAALAATAATPATTTASPTVSYCRIFDHAASKGMLAESGGKAMRRPVEEPFSGVEVDAATNTEAMTSLAPGDDFNISIIGPEASSASLTGAAAAAGPGGGGFREQPMISGAPALLTKFYPGGVDGAGVGVLIGEGGSAHITESHIFGNAVANVVFRSRAGAASRIDHSILSDAYLFGVVVEPGARDLTVVDCDLKENGLAGVLAHPGSASSWLQCRLMRNPVGGCAVADACTAFSSCWFGGSTVAGLRFQQNSRARVEDCFFNSNACAAEFWGGPPDASDSPRGGPRRDGAGAAAAAAAASEAAGESQFARLVFSNNDITNSTFCGVVVSGTCAPKLYRNIFRSHRGVAALMTRRGARAVVSCSFFCNNAFAVATRLAAEPAVSQNVFVDNETAFLSEWRSLGLFSLNSVTRCTHAAVMCRTAANPHFLYCLLEECAPIVVSTEGAGVYESLTFRNPRGDCFLVNRAGEPVIRNTSFALLHLVHRDKIFEQVQKIINSDRDVWKPPVIAVSVYGGGGGSSPKALLAPDAKKSGDNDGDSSSAQETARQRAKPGAHINSFARIAAAASEIMQQNDEKVLLTSASVVEQQPHCIIRVENGGKAVVERCLFLLNGCSSVLAVGALTSIALEHCVFSSHLRLPAVIVANLATGTLRDTLFTHNLRGVHVVRANPSVADCIFTANALSLEAGAGATVFTSNCQFVDDTLGVSALDGSFVTVKSSQFVGCEVGALFSAGSQANFCDNSASWCGGAACVLRTSPDHHGHVERCTFFGGRLALQIEDNCAVAVSQLDCVKLEQVALLVGDCLSVTVTDCKLRGCQIGVKCTGSKSAALLEKCLLAFNRIGVDVAEGANPTVLGCTAAGNDTAVRFHDEALGTLTKLEAHDNRVGVAIESGVEGFPSVTQCTIYDGDIGLLLDGDAVGECRRCAVHSQNTACVVARGRTLTELAACTLSTPVAPSSETQLLILSTEDSRLRVASDVNLCFNQSPAHRGRTVEQRRADAAKARKEHQQFLDGAEERFCREERLARAMIDRWIADVGACSTHAVDPAAPLNLLHRVVVMGAGSTADAFAGLSSGPSGFFELPQLQQQHEQDIAAAAAAAAAASSVRRTSAAGGDDPLAMSVSGIDLPSTGSGSLLPSPPAKTAAGAKLAKVSLKSVAKKVTDATKLVTKLGGASAAATAAPAAASSSLSALSAAAQALALTTSLLGRGGAGAGGQPSAAVRGLLAQSGLDDQQQLQMHSFGSASVVNAASHAVAAGAPLTGIVTVDAVVELVIAHGRRAARRSADAPPTAHEAFADTPASIEIELVRLGVATQNKITCGARADTQQTLTDLVAATAAAADEARMQGEDGVKSPRGRRKSAVTGGDSLPAADGAEQIRLADDDGDDLPLSPASAASASARPAPLKDRRRASASNNSAGSGGGTAAAGGRKGTGAAANRRRNGGQATTARLAQQHLAGKPASATRQQPEQPKRSSSRNNNSGSGSSSARAPASSSNGRNSSLGMTRSGSSMSNRGGAPPGSARGRKALLGVPTTSGRISPSAKKGATSSSSSGATAQVFHRTESRGGGAAAGGSKALSVRHNSTAATSAGQAGDASEQRAKDVLRKFMETMDPSFDVADEALGSVVQNVAAAKAAAAANESSSSGPPGEDAAPTAGTRPSSAADAVVSSGGGGVKPAPAAQKEAPVSLLPPITRLSQNHLILPEREYYAAQQDSGAGIGIAPRRRLDARVRPDEAGAVLPYLRPFPPSRLALDCFAQPQPHKHGYGPATLAAVVRISGMHNPLFADQLLHAFARADRQRREKLSCADVALFVMHLCEQYKFEPVFDAVAESSLLPGRSGLGSGVFFHNNNSMLHTSSEAAAAAAAAAASAAVANGGRSRSDSVGAGPSRMPSDVFGTHVSDGGLGAEDDATEKLADAVHRWVRDAWLDLIFMPDTACEIGLADFAKLVVLPHSPFAPLFKAHFTWMGRRAPTANAQ